MCSFVCLMDSRKVRYIFNETLTEPTYFGLYLAFDRQFLSYVYPNQGEAAVFTLSVNANLRFFVAPTFAEDSFDPVAVDGPFESPLADAEGNLNVVFIRLSDGNDTEHDGERLIELAALKKSSEESSVREPLVFAKGVASHYGLVFARNVVFNSHRH